MAEALRWYLATLAIGGAGLIPAIVLFPTLRSRGVLYARPLALVLLSVAVWWIGWNGTIPYGLGAVALILGWLWAVSAIVAIRRPELVSQIAGRWRLILGGEAVFVVVFALVALARAQAPNAAATEKPMDLMMLTAVHRADELPPPDPWLSGENVSYYHLGHLTTDTVGQLSANGPEIGFNLGIAMVAALAGSAIFGLAGDVLALSEVRRRATPWVAGVAGVLALLWVAPLASHRDIISRLTTDGEPSLLNSWWWWWDATRVFPQPITEFPAFSLLLGDLHAHVLALPISIVALAITVSTFQGQTPLTWRSWISRPERLLLAGAVFAALFMTNSWDVLTFGPLWFGAAFVAFRRVGWGWALSVFNAARYLALPVGAALLLAAPFIANLDTTSRAVELVALDASDPANWLLVWLVPLLPLVLGVVALRAGGTRRAALAGALAASLAVAVWTVLQVGSGNAEALIERSWGWIMLVVLVLLVGVGAGAIVRAEGERDAARSAWLALAVGAAVVMLATELINIETDTAGRFNTVFKLWYHLWTVIALAGAVAFAMVLDRVDWTGVGAQLRAPSGGAAAVVVAAGALVYLGAFVYAPAMALSRGNEGQPTGLDALIYLDQSNPGLAGAIEFAQTELDPERHVLLQAVGDAYGSGGYLAAASGVPTVLNWPSHQRQWRGPEAPLSGRREAVEQIYTLGADALSEQLASGFGVTHVYVGREERTQFGQDAAERFAGWEIAWEGTGAVIFAVPAPAEAVAAS